MITVTTVVDSSDDQYETVVSTDTTVEKTISVFGTYSVMVPVTATVVYLVELHVHTVTATVTVYGTVVSTQTGEHDGYGALTYVNPVSSLNHVC